MTISASVCSLCGLICITLRRPPSEGKCIKCRHPIEVFRGNDIDDLWRVISSKLPKAYASPKDRALLQPRFAAAYERYSSRARLRMRDRAVPPEWRGAAYFARKQLRESAAARARRRKVHEL